MNARPIFKIDLSEPFPHLDRAPIVESVIDIRARATAPWEATAVRASLQDKLEGYGFLDSQREIQHQLKLEPGKPPSQMLRDLGWKGVRFRSADQRHIVQFNRDGFVFSRLEPYPSWQEFSDEGLRLWRIFMDMAQPTEIHRIGLRFINRIQLPASELCFENYIEPAPNTPRGLGLPFVAFMHHDTLAVPGHPYFINVIRTTQRSPGPWGADNALILDIDVGTTQGSELDESRLTHSLQEMRWLKNKVFFGSVTEKAMENFR